MKTAKKTLPNIPTFIMMKSQEEILCQAANNLQPEDVNNALDQGANPFQPQYDGHSGLFVLIEKSRTLREISTYDPNPHSLVSRLYSSLDRMCSHSLGEDDKEEFKAILKDVTKHHAFNASLKNLVEQKAQDEGKKLSPQTKNYYKDKTNADQVMTSVLVSSRSYSDFSSLLSTEEAATFSSQLDISRQQGQLLAKEHLSLLDINEDGNISVRQTLPPNNLEVAPLSINAIKDRRPTSSPSPHPKASQSLS